MRKSIPKLHYELIKKIKKTKKLVNRVAGGKNSVFKSRR